MPRNRKVVLSNGHIKILNKYYKKRARSVKGGEKLKYYKYYGIYNNTIMKKANTPIHTDDLITLINDKFVSNGLEEIPKSYILKNIKTHKQLKEHQEKKKQRKTATYNNETRLYYRIIDNGDYSISRSDLPLLPSTSRKKFTPSDMDHRANLIKYSKDLKEKYSKPPKPLKNIPDYYSTIPLPDNLNKYKLYPPFVITNKEDSNKERKAELKRINNDRIKRNMDKLKGISTVNLYHRYGDQKYSTDDIDATLINRMNSAGIDLIESDNGFWFWGY